VPKYGFDPSWTDEQRRLALIEMCWDPATQAQLRSAGISDGWQCLEIGAGNGSIARWMRGEVGPSGRVVAMDLDTRFIADDSSLEAVQGDVLVDDLEEDAFDLVHCRAVLHHIAGKQVATLQRMLRALKPGGVMVTREPWLTPMFTAPNADYREGWRAVDSVVPADYEWAVNVANAFAEAGFTEIVATVDSDMVQGGTPLAHLTQLTFESVRSRLPADASIDAGIAALDDSSLIHPGPIWYGAIGRRPLLGE
jgi:SAM-dependent methyltransferase